MMFLDTSFLVEYVSGNQRAIERVEEERTCHASALSLFELFRGALHSENKEHNMEVVEDLDWVREHDVDKTVAREAAQIENELKEKGDKINLADIFIAASARKEGLKIVTADKDFHKIEGLEVEII